MAEYSIYRNSAIIATVTPTGKRQRKIMDINVVDFTFSLASSIDFEVGDYVVVKAEKYIIQELPDIKKDSTRQFDYTITFRGRAYELGKATLLGPDSDNNLTETDFAVMGNANTIIDLVIENANRVNPGWVKGTIDTTLADNFPFSATQCLTVLSTLADKYELEWWVVGTTIHMTKKGEVQPLTFQYGINGGLYKIARTTQQDKNICTRLYAYGSTDNLSGDYRSYSNRLKLPSPNIYIESNVDKYGIIEGVQIFEDVKPEYKGTITSIIDNFRFRDTGIDFDVQVQQLPSVKPQVTFLTGQLAGYTFEVGGWDNATKQVTILINQGEKAINLPSDLLHPQVGDTYSFLQINMPLAYQTDAESRLLIKATDWLDKNDTQIVVYSVTNSFIYFKENAITLNLGDYYHFIDTDFNLDDNIRVTAISEDLQNEFSLEIELQEINSVSQIVRSYNTYKGIKSAVNINKLSDINRARMSWKTTQQLRSMIYDPDGNYFDMGNIKPGSVETLMLSVGAKAQQFILAGVTLEPNYEGDHSQMAVTAGQLTQFSLFDTPHTWDISSTLLTGLTDATAYYIYAKCSKSVDTGEIILNATPIATEELAGYYVFWIGALHSVIDGVRGISLTYGQTTINGRFITTGRIQSNDGATYFDLDAGLIVGKIQFGANGESTIIDGNLVTTSAIVLGDASGQNAGITGDMTDGSTSVLLWLGSNYADRDTAPMRGLADGTVIMTQANITGVINAVSGNIGDFSILSGQLAMNKTHGSFINSVLIGDNVLPATSPNLKSTGIFRNLIENVLSGTGINYGMVLESDNADINIALEIVKGDVHFSALPDRSLSGTYTGKLRGYTDGVSGIQYVTIEND